MNATLTATRTQRDRPAGPSSRLNHRALALALVLGLLAALIALQGYARAAARHQVVVVVRNVPEGQPVSADDLGLADIATDGSAIKTVAATGRAAIVGKTAVHQLSAGSLLTATDVSSVPAVGPDERRVGASLKTGQYPSDLVAGDHIRVSGPAAAFAARVLRIKIANDGSAVAVLVTDVASADQLAALTTSTAFAVIADPKT
jgi:hypothetical protein